MKVKLEDVCKRIYAGGDVPKNRFSESKTKKYSVPIYANAEKNNGLYGYTDLAKEDELSITIAARGTIGFVAIRTEPFLPVVRLITLVPNLSKISARYLYYVLRNLKPKCSGTSIPQLTVPDIKKNGIKLYAISKQEEIADQLEILDNIIKIRSQEIKKLDDLIKARFVEMFGDPVINSKNLATKELKNVIALKAGDFTAASDILDEPSESNPYPCYGGNGVRGYVAEYNQEGEYSLIGRQGALSGNVQYVNGKFKNTEHALLVTPLVEINSIWLNQLLLNLDLKRYQTGAAQPGISVKNLQEIPIVCVSIDEQNQFADFVRQIAKSKSVIEKSLKELETLQASLMQKYFS